MASEAVRTKRVRRVKGTRLTMAIPETATAQKRKVVMPPRTEEGMATRAALNLAKSPIMIRKTVTQVY
jgi:hypothetical protein